LKNKAVDVWSWNHGRAGEYTIRVVFTRFWWKVEVMNYFLF